MATDVQDLKDDATHDEIQEFVDQAVKDVEADRVGDDSGTKTEDTSDSQQIAEENDEPVTTEAAETDSGSDDAADDGEDPGDSESQADWLDEDLEAEASAYGISEEELAEFSSREELERAMRFFNRAALKASQAEDSKEEDSAQASERGRDGRGRFVKADSKEEQVSEVSTEGQPDVALSDWWDDDAKSDLEQAFGKMRDHYESRIGAMESRLEELDAQAEEARYDAAIDAMGETRLFGKTGKESPAQLKRRQDLLPYVQAQDVAMRRLNVRLDLAKIVDQQARGLFTDHFIKKEVKSRTRDLTKQSEKRQGGGDSKPPGPEETTEEWAERYYKELEGG